jgi:tRNA-specific 2-thiouridylase
LKLRPEAAQPGEIVHVDGRVLGRHGGIINFTVGQRRGLKLAGGEPLYVVRIEPDAGRVVVGPRASLMQQYVPLKDVNWLGAQPITSADGMRLYIKVRSTRPAARARLAVASGETAVILDEMEAGVSPGQACVFYERAGSGARILGGGIISRTESRRGHAISRRPSAAFQLENDASVAI